MGELCEAACSSQGQASTFFPLMSNCTQASPMLSLLCPLLEPLAREQPFIAVPATPVGSRNSP